MIDACTRLSDRMPSVAAGQDRWTADESAHLSSCADCAAEWELVQRTSALGREDTRFIDTAQLATDVVARVRVQRRLRGLRRSAAAVAGLAAAAALLFAVWTADTPETRAPEAPEAAFVLPLVELEALEADELEVVLDGLAAPLSEGTSLDTPTLGDLESTELERVLHAWEG